MPDFDLDTLLITAAGVTAFLAVVMVAYTVFGLWLLSTPVVG